MPGVSLGLNLGKFQVASSSLSPFAKGFPHLSQSGLKEPFYLLFSRDARGQISFESPDLATQATLESGPDVVSSCSRPTMC